ncbi:hypothetical protein CYMTET_28226, partial [Cymbomonas tetramitiformis]
MPLSELSENTLPASKEREKSQLVAADKENGNQFPAKDACKTITNSTAVSDCPPLPVVAKPDTVLKLEQFQAVPWLNFGSVNITESATSAIKVKNDKKFKQDLVVDRLPRDSKEFSVSVRRVSVDAFSEHLVQVTWTPAKPGPQRETIVFLWQGRYRLQVILYGVAVDANRNIYPDKGARKRVAEGSKLSSTDSKSKLARRGTTCEVFEGKQPGPGSAPGAKPRTVLPVSAKRGRLAKPKSRSLRLIKSTTGKDNRKVTKPSGAQGCGLRASSKRGFSHFHTERWMDKQEMAFTRWINHLLPAPQKEHVPSCAYYKRLEVRARGVLQRLYVADKSLIAAMLKVERAVDERRLMLDRGSSLLHDIGVQKRMLDALACYHPFWLRLGLETILQAEAQDTVVGNHYARVIPEDAAHLQSFILSTFLRDVTVDNEHGRGGVEGLYWNRDEREEALGQSVLKRFLLLVLLLDRGIATCRGPESEAAWGRDQP